MNGLREENMKREMKTVEKHEEKMKSGEEYEDMRTKDHEELKQEQNIKIQKNNMKTKEYDEDIRRK